MVDILMDTDTLSIVGPPDVVTLVTETGATGPRGNSWYAGHGLPSETTIPDYSLLLTDDLYMDVLTGAIYQYLLLPSNTNNWVLVYTINVGSDVELNATKAYDAYLDAVAAKEVAEQAEADASTYATTAATKAGEATTAANTAIVQAGLAQTAATNAYNSEISADADQATVTQTMQDFLAMLGTDVATLTNGKLTSTQVPNLSITSTFTVVDTTAMLALTAQEGDVALIVPVDVVTDTYILAGANPTILSNWKKLGVGYVAESGHAINADEAVNATKINDHRIVVMTQAQYDAAVKDPDTVYLVSGA